MKHLILAVALVGCIVACNTEKRSVSDPAAPNAPKAECCEGTKAGACTEGQKAECSGMKKACCQESAKPQG
jgi:hypothetical protein